MSTNKAAINENSKLNLIDVIFGLNFAEVVYVIVLSLSDHFAYISGKTVQGHEVYAVTG